MAKKNGAMEILRKRISLKTKLTVAFQMEDYDNWNNGFYYGNAEKYVDVALREIEKHEREKKEDSTESNAILPDVINCADLDPEFKQALDDLCKKFNKPTKKRF